MLEQPSIPDALSAVLALPSSWVAAGLEWNWLGTNDATAWRYAVSARTAKDAGDESRASYWMARLREHATKERARYLRDNPGVARRLRMMGGTEL